MSSSHVELGQDAPNISITSPDAASVLATAASSAPRQDRPSPHALVVSLLDQERQTKRSPQPLSAGSLLGTWRLRFTAPKKPAYKSGKPVGSGFYIPALAKATLSFFEDAEQPQKLGIQNQLQVGLLKLRFTGPAKVLAPKNLLAFDFTHLELGFGNLNLLRLPIRGGSSRVEDFATTPVGKLPFFAFFAAQPSYIAARGRGGGLALWGKEA